MLDCVIGGNCGFTLAPLNEADADYIRRMMAKVEGMSLAALEQGVPWGWESFGEFLGGLDRSIAVNAGFLLRDCALRRYVMGADAVGREATADEVERMTRALHEAIEAGGLGLSTTRSSTHNDGDGEPVASRWADPDELLTLCDVVGRHEGTTLEAIVSGCLDRFSDDEIDLLATMSARARRPLNWNVLTFGARDRDKVTHQLQASDRAREMGGRVVALTMPVHVPMNMSFLTFCALWLIPGWNEVLDAPVPERIRRLLDPEVRQRMLDQAADSPTFKFLANFGNYVIGDAFSRRNAEVKGRRVDELALERGTDPFTCVAEIVAEDELRTVLWPQPAADGDADWAVRGRRLLPLERAVQLITDVPARLFGLRDRGRLEVGGHADIVVFDPDTIDAGPPTLVPDLPGESKRLIAESVGVHHVFVNGVESVVDGEPTGATPGTVLRSGRDTHTVR